MELRAFEHDEAVAVFAGAGEADGFAAEIFGGLGMETLLDETAGVGEREGLSRGDVGIRAVSGSGGEEQRERAKSEVEANHAPNDTAAWSEGTRFL